MNTSDMITVIPGEVPVPVLHQYLVGAVAPRPIAFVSSISANGNRNLSPYSFFNVFGSKPPILVFSPNHRVRDHSEKDTYHNVMETMEVVVNVVTYDMVHQMSLASGEYPAEVDEFVKAGFTPLDSIKVKPPRVAESPVQMECIVRQVISMGEGGGASNLVICEVVAMHIHPGVLNENGIIDPQKIDLVSRMGKMYYTRASGEAVFSLPQPNQQYGIGFDQLPAHIRTSSILNGRQLAMLASVVELPAPDEAILQDENVMNALAGNTQEKEMHLHRYAANLLDNNQLALAWQVLLAE